MLKNKVDNMMINILVYINIHVYIFETFTHICHIKII